MADASDNNAVDAVDAGAVTVAYVHPAEVSHSWHLSLMELVAHDLANEQRVWRGGWAAMRCGTDGLPGARNKAVEQFLADNRADWLWWIDTDMGFAPDTVDRLMAAADPIERPIVGALCFAQRERTPDGMGGYHCMPAATIFDWVNVDGYSGFQGRTTYPVNGLARCAGTGSACILIHRSVFERIAEVHGPTWYDRATIPTAEGPQTVSEDLSFCLRAGALNIALHVHTGVRTTHLKRFWLSEDHYWERVVAPPATEPVAVVVPVLRRPANAAPFMASLRASTGLATVYAMCDVDDRESSAAWLAAGATVIAKDYGPAPGTFAQKVNDGYRAAREAWLFIVGDDVRFHPGWLDHAQAAAGDTFHVVGTNDLGNPRVTSGEHATHLLIRRPYVEEQGGSWDGPGVVAHDGYRHWYVDDEIVTAAKQRGVWAMALAAKVEHLHPIFGKAEPDEVYQLGQSHAETDRKLFEQRRALHLGGDRAARVA